MKTSISSRLLPSSFAPSRSRRIVDAGRDADASAIRLTCGAGLWAEIGALVDAGDARQQVLHLCLRRRRDSGAGLALGTGGDDAALLQHVFAHGKASTRLVL